MFTDYINYLKCKETISQLNKKISQSQIKEFEFFLNENLKNLEKIIFTGYYLEDKSLKDISKELSYSYSYIQMTHSSLKSKLEMGALLIFKNNKS